MSSPGSRPKRGGFMAGLQAMMAPPIPAQDSGPLVRPRSITVASALVLIAAVLYLLIGALSVTSASSQVNLQVKQYNTVIAQCNQIYGGIGTSAVPTSAPTPTSLATTIVAATALPSACRSVTEATLSPSSVSSIRTSIVVFSIVLIIVGLATGVSGWYLRGGRRWTRRVLIVMVLVNLVLAFLFQASTPVTLLATLLMVVGLSITFLGKAAAYVMAVAARKPQH